MSAANNLVGTAGEYYVCAELCRRGYLALLTPKNNPLFDVVATNMSGSKSVAIQVKTRSERNTQGWKLGTDITKKVAPAGMFIALVNLVPESAPEIYIYEYTVLSKRITGLYEQYLAKPKRDGSARKDVGFRWFDEVNFIEDDHGRKNRWGPIVDALGS
ncbi:aspartate-ammonia lyase [Solimonas sp. K1W22B-7]|uniref:aspartate-ammonia lyase n=1 Tax=Solimonas sp. K1W22B-7 TaxID=2303331 RepID=UPI000E32EC4E|nr:aspartate-ammonia lyase [Solimonas sp. K1W22B-7]AXQ28506.1 aspartate-ammonia lyase [Solimonas sp. K1W22B-7]